MFTYTTEGIKEKLALIKADYKRTRPLVIELAAREERDATAELKDLKENYERARDTLRHILDKRRIEKRVNLLFGYSRMCENVLFILQGLDDLGPIEDHSPKKRCKLCKGLFSSVDMAVKAVGGSGSDWNVADATWCGSCSENRAEGLMDENWEPKVAYPERRPLRHRLADGFRMLAERGGFG